MSKRIRFPSPAELHDQLIKQLTEEALAETRSEGFESGWGGSIVVGVVNDGIIKEVILNLSLQGIVAEAQDGDTPSDRYLSLNKKPVDPEQVRLDHCRAEFLKSLAKVGLPRDGIPPEILVESTISNSIVEAIIVELRAEHWTVEMTMQDDGSRLIRVTPAYVEQTL